MNSPNNAVHSGGIMKVFFITRFSTYDPQFGGFRLTKNYEKEEYEGHPFDKHSLDRKYDEKSIANP